jgi:hypothetical protein
MSRDENDPLSQMSSSSVTKCSDTLGVDQKQNLEQLRASRLQNGVNVKNLHPDEMLQLKSSLVMENIDTMEVGASIWRFSKGITIHNTYFSSQRPIMTLRDQQWL